MKNDNEKKENKLEYEKPRLRAIELAAEEVLATGCKTSASGTAFGGGPTCIIRNCAGAGS